MRMTNTYIGPHTPPGTLRATRRPVPLPVVPQMTRQESRAKWTVANVLKYAKAVTSRIIKGKTSRRAQEARRKACLSCEHLRRKAGDPEPLGWCGACGCGGSRRASLSLKITMPQATCPKGKWPLP